jgi:single-strand DNA-binding protein
MIRASIYGRIGADPVQRETKAGKPIVTASVGINVAKAGAEPLTEWVNVAAFAAVGGVLAQHSKGDLVAMMGQLTKSVFTGRDGEQRTGWGLLVESILSVHTAVGNKRPRGQRVPRAARASTSFYASPGPPGQATALPNDGVDDLYADGVVP